MAPINQIPRLTKIPQLLNKKREAEKESKNKKEEQEAPPFPPEDKSVLKKAKISKIEKPRKDANPQSADKTIGSNIDLTA